MKMSRVIENYMESAPYLSCPLCRASFSLTENGSFLCEKGHCFDLSSKGYVNFIPGQNRKKMKYDKNLFENRKRIFLDGFYERILAEAAEQIRNHFMDQKDGIVLDAGCGEGYYTLQLWKNEVLREKADFFGMDIVKDAISMACTEASSVKWMVANLNRIPMQKGSVDVLLNILTVADYEEFSRVLKEDGILIKVIPGAHYLQEIRECIAKQLEHKTHSSEPVAEHLKKQMNIVERKEICYQMPVTPEQTACFLKMTPMTFGIDTALLDCSEIHEITIHLEILTAKIL